IDAASLWAGMNTVTVQVAARAAGGGSPAGSSTSGVPRSISACSAMRCAWADGSGSVTMPGMSGIVISVAIAPAGRSEPRTCVREPSGAFPGPDRFSRSTVTTQAVDGLLGDGDSSNDDQSQKPDRRREALRLSFLAPAHDSSAHAGDCQGTIRVQSRSVFPCKAHSDTSLGVLLH